MRNFGKLGLTSLYSRYLHQRTGTTFDGFASVVLSNKKIKNMTKKSDISRRKFKNIESPKMVSKQLKAHYLRSYEQFQKISDFKCFFVFLFVFYFHVISYQAPFGAQRLSLYTARAEGPSCVDGWVGGSVVIFYPLRFSLFLSMLTSNMCLFQNWA